MEINTTYPAALQVVEDVSLHFSRNHAMASSEDDRPLAPLPDGTVIEALLSVAFWASLRREEGHSPKISLAYLSPAVAQDAIIFEHQLELTAEVLIKLSPGVERPGIHVGVWQQNGKLFVWGTTRNIPGLCFVVDVSEPGLLVIKHRRLDGFGKFTNVAILQGDQVKIIDEQVSKLPDCPSLLSSLLGMQSKQYWYDSLNVLVQLAVSIRAHGRGGILLIVPHNSASWKQSIIHPLHYAISPAFSGLGQLVAQQDLQHEQLQWQAAVRQEISGIAGLTAIDGATIMTDRYELLAFGAKIARANNKEIVNKLSVTEPIIGSIPTMVHPSKSGGTRHLSAAQFVHDQPDALALVASQDGRFTIFSWSECDQTVQAHRIESLLL